MRNWTIVYENRLELHMKSREMILKAVRKIKPNSTSTTGSYSSLKNLAHIEFESSLEADFIRMLEFDLKVDRFVQQPVKIYYTDERGKKRSYTPDFIVYFKEDPMTNAPYHCPLLCEVKPRHLLKKYWKMLKPKFRAAMRHCSEVGWKFKIQTDKEIKTQFTKNIKFLLPFMKQTPDYGLIQKIQHALQSLRSSTPKELIRFYSKEVMNQAELVAPLWYLVGNQRVGCDLSGKLTMNTKIWLLDR